MWTVFCCPHIFSLQMQQFFKEQLVNDTFKPANDNRAARWSKRCGENPRSYFLIAAGVFVLWF